MSVFTKCKGSHEEEQSHSQGFSSPQRILVRSRYSVWLDIFLRFIDALWRTAAGHALLLERCKSSHSLRGRVRRFRLRLTTKLRESVTYASARACTSVMTLSDKSRRESELKQANERCSILSISLWDSFRVRNPTKSSKICRGRDRIRFRDKSSSTRFSRPEN